MLWWRCGRDGGGEKTQRSGFCDVLGARGAKEERTWQCEEGAQRATGAEEHAEKTASIR